MEPALRRAVDPPDDDVQRFARLASFTVQIQRLHRRTSTGCQPVGNAVILSRRNFAARQASNSVTTLFSTFLAAGLESISIWHKNV
jgi:hypothetical protein